MNEKTETRLRKGAATRLALMDAARNVFVRLGFLNTEIRDITIEIGRSPGVFYLYFKNKEHLLEEMIADFENDFYQKLDSKPQDPSVLNLGLILEKFWLVYSRHWPEMYALEQASLVNPEFAGKRHTIIRQGIERFISIIREGQRLGDRYNNLDAELTGVALVGLIEHFANHWNSNRSEFELRGIDQKAAFINLAEIIGNVIGEKTSIPKSLSLTS